MSGTDEKMISVKKYTRDNTNLFFGQKKSYDNFTNCLVAGTVVTLSGVLTKSLSVSLLGLTVLFIAICISLTADEKNQPSAGLVTDTLSLMNRINSTGIHPEGITRISGEVLVRETPEGNTDKILKSSRERGTKTLLIRTKTAVWLIDPAMKDAPVNVIFNRKKAAGCYLGLDDEECKRLLKQIVTGRKKENYMQEKVA
jgi:hypothetical protein